MQIDKRIEELERRVAELDKRVSGNIALAAMCDECTKKDVPAVKLKQCFECGEKGSHDNKCSYINPEATPVECRNTPSEDKAILISSFFGYTLDKNDFRVRKIVEQLEVTLSEPSEFITCTPEAAKELRAMGIPVEPSKDNGKTIGFKDRSLRNIVRMIENGNMSTASASWEIKNIFEVMELLKERSHDAKDSVRISRKVAKEYLEQWGNIDTNMSNEIRNALESK